MHFSHERSASPKIEDLLIELAEIRSSFMIHISIGDQSNPEPSFFHSKAQLNIFRKAIELITSSSFKNLSRQTHIEAARLKPPNVFFPSANASGGKHRRHRVSHCALQKSKIRMRSVRATPAIEALLLQTFFDCFKILWRYNTIRIKKHEVVSLREFCSFVTAWTGTRVWFIQILNFQFVSERIDINFA